MSAGWLVYAMVSGSLLALAATAVEGVARTRRWPTRWIWAAFLIATMALIASSAWSAATPAHVTPAGSVATATSITGSATSSPVSVLLGELRGVVESAILAGMATGARHLPPWVDDVAGRLWVTCAVIALSLLALVHVRLRRARRSWPRAELHGRIVCVAPRVGPAVVGVLRPVIVVPRWLLERDAREQQLVLEHEQEHVRARDHLLLGGACVAVALMPWHPAAWWSLARLRLAIELDCDARVLRGGVPARTYGEMLIDLAGQCSGFRVGATALADKTSHLERRLLAMRPTTKRYPLLRAGTLCAAAALSLAVACEARVPTSAEVQTMDVASAKRLAEKTGLFDATHDANTQFYVNDVKVTAEQAHAIPSGDIATVNVQGAPNAGGPSVIRVVTVAATAGGMKYRTGAPGATGQDGVPAESKRLHEKVSLSRETFTGIVLIDGTRADVSALNRLDPKDIVSVDVIKGAAAAAAAALSSDPAATNGIIKVTTKGVRKAG